MSVFRLRGLYSHVNKINRSICPLLQNKLSTAAKPEDPDDKPVRFSTSKAAKTKISHLNVITKYENQRSYVINISIALLLLYFCVLREENDLDEKLEKSLPELFDTIKKERPDFEEPNLKLIQKNLKDPLMR